MARKHHARCLRPTLRLPPAPQLMGVESDRIEIANPGGAQGRRMPQIDVNAIAAFTEAVRAHRQFEGRVVALRIGVAWR